MDGGSVLNRTAYTVGLASHPLYVSDHTQIESLEDIYIVYITVFITQFSGRAKLIPFKIPHSIPKAVQQQVPLQQVGPVVEQCVVVSQYFQVAQNNSTEPLHHNTILLNLGNIACVK